MNMDLDIFKYIFGAIGLVAFLYYFISILCWIYLDSDIELFVYQKFGKRVSSLKGKVIWITGASSGLGKELAILLAKNGVRLCISARRLDELEKVKKECLSVAPRTLKDDDILVVQMDMLDLAKHDYYFQKVISHFDGQLDVLVNNAGRTQRATWANIDMAVDRDMFELNVFSVVNLSRIYVRYIQEHKLRGHIFVTSSVAGLAPLPFSACYIGAKFALNGYFSALKVECSDIDVTIFCPGPTFSNLLEEAFTKTAGERYGEAHQKTDVRMTTDRCAYQMGVAIANKLYINFNGLYPFMIFMYISCYYPNVMSIIFKIVGRDGLMKIRDTKTTIKEP